MRLTVRHGLQRQATIRDEIKSIATADGNKIEVNEIHKLVDKAVRVTDLDE